MNVNFFYTWARKKKKNKILSGNFSLPKVIGGIAKIIIPGSKIKKRDPE